MAPGGRFSSLPFISLWKEIMTLAEKIQRIQENQEKINSQSPFPEEVLKRIHYRFRLDWNYHSHKIEGGTLTRAETRSVMVGNIEVHGKPFRDVAEMNGHDEVVRDVLKISKGELKLSEKRLKEVHKAIILPDTPEEKNLVGNWKTEPNEVYSYKGEKIGFAAPQDVRELMHGLIDRTNASLNKIAEGKADAPHPVVLAADFHIDYVTIHPFFDGNGRTARIFTNLILIACGFPPVIIRDDHKKIYSQHLGDIQAYGGSRDLFYGFLADRMLESQKLMLSAIAGDTLEELDDIDKEMLLLKQQLAAKEQVAIPRTWENISDVQRNAFIPLVFGLAEKVSPIIDLFNEVRISFYVDNYGESMFFRDKDYWAQQFEIALSQEKSKQPKAGIYSMAMALDFKGLKSHLDRNYFSISINIQFDEYSLTLKGPGGSEKKYPYRSADILADKDKWVNEWVGNLIAEIRRATQLE
jgi:Fic family protein